jgi:hypothetical protein
MSTGAWSWMRECAVAGATLPRTIGFTALGASATAGRWLLDALYRIVGVVDSGRRAPRHNENAVREQVRAAVQAARAAGVFGRR